MLWCTVYDRVWLSDEKYPSQLLYFVLHLCYFFPCKARVIKYWVETLQKDFYGIYIRKLSLWQRLFKQINFRNLASLPLPKQILVPEMIKIMKTGTKTYETAYKTYQSEKINKHFDIPLFSFLSGKIVYKSDFEYV